MKPAWIRREFNTTLISSTVQRIVKFKVKMKLAWIGHEFGVNFTPIWCQLLYKALWKRVCTNHRQTIYSLSVSFLNYNRAKKQGLARTQPPTQATSFISFDLYICTYIYIWINIYRYYSKCNMYMTRYVYSCVHVLTCLYMCLFVPQPFLCIQEFHKRFATCVKESALCWHSHIISIGAQIIFAW